VGLKIVIQYGGMDWPQIIHPCGWPPFVVPPDQLDLWDEGFEREFGSWKRRDVNAGFTLYIAFSCVFRRKGKKRVERNAYILVVVGQEGQEEEEI
jgi:hypothetical protein